ncbi:MAG: HU family DNA-binding protein [Paracoccaceae bacterium]|nr:HU family DNA-binding protein [Paracoccaceae bacterium]
MKQPSSKLTAAPATRAPKTAAAGAKAPKTAKPVVAAEVEETPVLRKRDLVLRAAESSGVKKKDTRAVVEAVLAEIGAALSRGEGLILPPLGKAKINRQKDIGTGEVLVLRLRRSGKDEATAGAEGGLAEAGD